MIYPSSTKPLAPPSVALNPLPPQLAFVFKIRLAGSYPFRADLEGLSLSLSIPRMNRLSSFATPLVLAILKLVVSGHSLLSNRQLGSRSYHRIEWHYMEWGLVSVRVGDPPQDIMMPLGSRIHTGLPVGPCDEEVAIYGCPPALCPCISPLSCRSETDIFADQSGESESFYNATSVNSTFSNPCESTGLFSDTVSVGAFGILRNFSLFYAEDYGDLPSMGTLGLGAPSGPWVGEDNCDDGVDEHFERNIFLDQSILVQLARTEEIVTPAYSIWYHPTSES